jgi:hypothetical protein
MKQGASGKRSPKAKKGACRRPIKRGCVFCTRRFALSQYQEPWFAAGHFLSWSRLKLAYLLKSLDAKEIRSLRAHLRAAPGLIGILSAKRSKSMEQPNLNYLAKP